MPIKIVKSCLPYCNHLGLDGKGFDYAPTLRIARTSFMRIDPDRRKHVASRTRQCNRSKRAFVPADANIQDCRYPGSLCALQYGIRALRKASYVEMTMSVNEQ